MQINNERRIIQIEALTALEKNNYNGIFLLPTGTGKSWVLIQALKNLVQQYGYKKIWYLCNSTDLRDKDFAKELEEWDALDLKEHITFMCYQTAYKLSGEDVDVILADEFDYSLSDKYSRVYVNNKFKHALLTTAYIDRKKMRYVQEIGVPIVYVKQLQEVEEKKVLNKSTYYYVNFEMSELETLRYKSLNSSISELKGELQQAQFANDAKLVARLQKRMDYFVMRRKQHLGSLESSAFYCRKLMQDIYNKDKNCKILTFCELTVQADRVCKYSYHNGSDQTNLDKFRNDEIQALSVCGKINRGVNIKGVRHIIFESCNQSKTQMIQRLGRGKRLKQDELLNVYFLIPCYRDYGTIKFTKVRDWIRTATASLDMSEAKVYRF